MTDPLQVTIRYGEHSYHAAVEPDERADQLLLRSLYHFGIEADEKGGWKLRRRREDEREAEGLVLDHPIGEQVRSGGELVLEADVAGNRPMSTGSY